MFNFNYKDCLISNIIYDYSHLKEQLLLCYIFKLNFHISKNLYRQYYNHFEDYVCKIFDKLKKKNIEIMLSGSYLVKLTSYIYNNNLNINLFDNNSISGSDKFDLDFYINEKYEKNAIKIMTNLLKIQPINLKTYNMNPMFKIPKIKTVYNFSKKKSIDLVIVKNNHNIYEVINDFDFNFCQNYISNMKKIYYKNIFSIFYLKKIKVNEYISKIWLKNQIIILQDNLYNKKLMKNSYLLNNENLLNLNKRNLIKEFNLMIKLTFGKIIKHKIKHSFKCNYGKNSNIQLSFNNVMQLGQAFLNLEILNKFQIFIYKEVPKEFKNYLYFYSNNHIIKKIKPTYIKESYKINNKILIYIYYYDYNNFDKYKNYSLNLQLTKYHEFITSFCLLNFELININLIINQLSKSLLFSKIIFKLENNYINFITSSSHKQIFAYESRLEIKKKMLKFKNIKNINYYKILKFYNNVFYKKNLIFEIIKFSRFNYYIIVIFNYINRLYLCLDKQFSRIKKYHNRGFINLKDYLKKYKNQGINYSVDLNNNIYDIFYSMNI